MSLLKTCFANIPDPRRAQGKRYDLPHMLMYSVLAIVSGAISYRRIHQFIATHWQRLNEVFGSNWRKAPAYTSIRYTLQGLDAADVEQAFRAHINALLVSQTDKVRPLIALDGKTLRGSLDNFEDRKAAQVLSAFLVDAKLVLGHILIEDKDKDHEIQAAQRLINELGLAGHLYTLDALHCQKNSRTGHIKWRRTPCAAQR